MGTPGDDDRPGLVVAPDHRPYSYPYNLEPDIDGYTWYNAHLVACMPTMGRDSCYETLTMNSFTRVSLSLDYHVTTLQLAATDSETDVSLI